MEDDPFVPQPIDPFADGDSREPVPLHDLTEPTLDYLDDITILRQAYDSLNMARTLRDRVLKMSEQYPGQISPEHLEAAKARLAQAQQNYDQLAPPPPES